MRLTLSSSILLFAAFSSGALLLSGCGDSSQSSTSTQPQAQAAAPPPAPAPPTAAHVAAQKAQPHQVAVDWGPKPSETLQKMSEARRYDLWSVIKGADDRAFKQAGGNPDTDNGENMDDTDMARYSDLNEKYREQICRRYHITEGDIACVKGDAIDNHWPGWDK